MPGDAGDLKYRRALVKLSGESLAGNRGFGIDPPVIDPGTLMVTADNVDEVEALFEAGYAG